MGEKKRRIWEYEKESCGTVIRGPTSVPQVRVDPSPSVAAVDPGAYMRYTSVFQIPSIT